MQRTFRRSLNQWLDAVAQRRKEIAEGAEGARGGLSRLARALATTAAAYAMDELALAARMVGTAQDEAALQNRLDELVDTIRRAMHPSDRSRRTVLIVSNDEATTRVLLETARPYAHRVECVDTTLAARSFVSRHVPGLVLLDAGLDDDPLDWLVELREAPVALELPVVVIAPFGVMRNESLVLGASEFLRKPVDLQILEASLGAHLGHEGRTMLELAGDPATGLPGPALFQEAVSDQSIRHHGRKWAVAIMVWQNRQLIETADRTAAMDVARELSDALRAHFPDPVLLARLDKDTFGMLIPQALQDRLQTDLTEFLSMLSKRRLAGRFEVALTVGGVLCLEASYSQILSTAKRMQHLAAIAGEGVLLTTLEEAPHQRLLLVDEDPEVADVIRGVLRHGRYDVVHRRNVLEGLEAAAAKAFDLVLVNASLPNQGGYDLLRTLRGWPHYTARPIVLLTGEDRERVRAYELGADDCIGKPFNPEVVRARVRSLLQRDTPR